jgi:hypothetical protein
MLKKFILPIFILALSSCSLFIEPMPKSWNWGAKPRPLTGVKNFPEATSEYGKGFRDGCSTSLDSSSKGLSSDINEKRYDFKRSMKSADYGNGWWDGFEQCVYILDWDVL